MKKLIFFIYTLLLVLPFNLYSQKNNAIEPCASDIMNQKLIGADPDFSTKMNQFEAIIKKEKLKSRKAGQKYVIPVVIHIMHKGEDVGKGTNITNEEVFFKMKAINEEYRKVLGSSGDGAGVDVGLEFALAVRDPANDKTDGIVRFDMSAYSRYMSNGINSDQTQGMSDADLKSLSFWDSTQYYNIWLVSEIDNNEGAAGVQGYAYYASQHGSAIDGAVILSNSFKNLRSTTEVHEIGHAFNLYHTFEGDENGLNCPTERGDFCNDTAPHKRTIKDCSVIGNNPCDGNSSNLLFINNYMSYSYDSCRNMFTNDQKNRIITALTTIRKSFLPSEGNNRLVPVSLPSSNFVASEQLININEGISFYDTSLGMPNNYLNGDSWDGLFFEWKFTNGTTSLTSSIQNPSITFSEAGNYTVMLKVTNSFGADIKTQTEYIHVAGPVALTSIPKSENAGNYGYTIHEVYFNNIENITDPFLNTPYTDFSNLHKTFVVAGQDYFLEIVTHAGTSSNNPEYHAVYIDYNNNGVYEESEKISQGITTSNQYGQFVELVKIPTSAVKNKLLRMRIAGNGKSYIDNDLINARTNYWAGDVEDYGVFVIDSETLPVASFTVSNTLISEGESVTFTDTSTNDTNSWEWKISKDGVIIFSSLLQNPIITFTESGLYTVELKVGNNTGNNTKIEPEMITVNEKLSTPDFNKATLLYYPNPVNNILYVTNKENRITKIEVFNILGQLILMQNHNSDKVTVDFSKLQKGEYLICCYLDNKKSLFKIIKN